MTSAVVAGLAWPGCFRQHNKKAAWAGHAQLAANTDVPRPSGAAGRDAEWAAYLATATARRTS